MLKLGKRSVLVLGIGLLGIVSLALAAPSLKIDRELASCAALEHESRQVDCVFEIIENGLDEGGLPYAFDIFAKAYKKVPAITQIGCHRSSHRMGDLAYYRLYVPAQSMAGIDFVQETTTCGYGFYHGFFEHLIQDRPDPALVVEVCEDIGKRLGREIGAVRITCYHGSGHGFALAGSEQISPEQWGKVGVFTDEPLRRCEALPGVGEREIEECRQGVFNILVDWMSIGQYGFSYDMEKPFSTCDGLPVARHHHACYYETAMKLDSVSGYDPRVIWQLVKYVPPDLARVAFGVGVAGLMQHVVVQEGGYRTALQQCSELAEDLYMECITYISNGLFEHGEPSQEYRRALELCAEPLVAEHEFARTTCYDAVARRLLRFYPPERAAKICEEFPEDRRTHCAEVTRRS